MSETLIRHLRLYCLTPTSPPIECRDGILAVAAIREAAGLARLLLVDMGPFGRNRGASATNAIATVLPLAHRRLIAGFGIALAETLAVERDSTGAFDLIRDFGDGMGYRFQPLHSMTRGVAARSELAFLAVTGGMGRAMLERMQAVLAGSFWGIEG